MSIALSPLDKAKVHILFVDHPDHTWIDLVPYLDDHLKTGHLLKAANNRHNYLKKLKSDNPTRFWQLYKTACTDRANLEAVSDTIKPAPKVEQHQPSTNMDNDEIYPDDHPSATVKPRSVPSRSTKAKKTPPIIPSSVYSSPTPAAAYSSPSARKPRAAASPSVISSPPFSRGKTSVLFESMDEALETGTCPLLTC